MPDETSTEYYPPMHRNSWLTRNAEIEILIFPEIQRTRQLFSSKQLRAPQTMRSTPRSERRKEQQNGFPLHSTSMPPAGQLPHTRNHIIAHSQRAATRAEEQSHLSLCLSNTGKHCSIASVSRDQTTLPQTKSHSKHRPRLESV